MNESINLCFVDMMHQCSFSNWKQHRHCQFVEKNRFLDKCTHCQSDIFCQNLEAYPTAKTIPVKEEDLPKIYRGESEEVWGVSVLEQMHRAGKILDEQSVPTENRILADYQSEYAMVPHKIWKVGPEIEVQPRDFYRPSDEMDLNTWLETLKHYIMCSIDDWGYGAVVRDIHIEQDQDRHRYHDQLTFRCRTRYGDIFQILLVPHRPTEDIARRNAREMGEIFVQHMKSLENKMMVNIGHPPKITIKEWS